MSDFITLNTYGKNSQSIKINLSYITCMYESGGATFLRSGSDTYKVIETIEEINTISILGV